MKLTNHPLHLWLSYLLAAILLLVPFHAFGTVWLSSVAGHYTALRLWDEGVLILGLLLAIGIVGRRTFTLTRRGRWLMSLSAAYVLIHLLIGAVALARQQVNPTAFGDGLILNLRPVAVFWLAVVAMSESDWLKRHWANLLIAPALIVIVFGLLQITVLPHNFLTHFGYGPQTIAVEETIDNNTSYQRIQSTTRGANPLGAYLVIVIATLAVLGLTSRQPRRKLVLGLCGALALAALFFTYSRSAWIGSGLALLAVAATLIRLKHWRWLAAGGVLLVILAGLSTVTLRHNVHFENTFFHTNQRSHSRSSNADHLTALQQGVRDVWHHPLGSGPGTAGPASAHNNHAVRIAENYYVQLAQEVGVIGLGLFVGLNVLIAQTLWQRRRDPLALALLASLVGITFVNLLSHAWTDDTLAFVWWTLVGIAISTSIASADQPVLH